MEIKSFEQILKENQSSTKTVDDGIEYLSIWNNELSILINDIIGYDSEEMLIENSIQKLSETHPITMEVSTRVAELSERILGLSKSIDIIIRTIDNNGQLNEIRHNSFIFQVNAGIHTMLTVQEMIDSSDFLDLQDILIGLKKNFGEFYNAYKTALNIIDPNKKSGLSLHVYLTKSV